MPSFERSPVSIRPLFGASAERTTGRRAPYLGTFARSVVLEQTGDTAQRTVQGWSLLRSRADIRHEGDEAAVIRPELAPIRFSLA